MLDYVAELVSSGVDRESLQDDLDFTAFEKQFTGNDTFLLARFRDYFEEPIVEAAFLLETGAQPESRPQPFSPE